MRHSHRTLSALFAVIAGMWAVSPATAQSPHQSWRKVGNSSLDLGLASPASGSVSEVWFSADGSILYARTPSGRIFASSDLENWAVAASDSALREPVISPFVHHLPEPRAIVRADRNGRAYALGSNVYGSEDGGRTWINLTGFNNKSVIGSGERDLAVSPRDPQVLIVANDFGVWRSNDGGLSWSGLNENFPHLAVREILNPAAPVSALQIDVSGFGTVENDPAAQSWRIISAGSTAEQDRQSVSKAIGAKITALTGSGDTWYAGSADGRLWVSTDRRTSWTASQVQANGPVDRLFADPDNPRIAFAAAAGTGAHIFRTINSGLFWDDITGSLTDAPAHGIAVDRTKGAVYVATDRGVFLGRLDVNALGAVSAWTPLNPPAALAGDSAGAKAMDVKLDASGNRLLAAFDGYGVYETAAPHAAGAVRLVNAADMTQRAAAPGSLYSVLGAQVQSASAGRILFPVLAASSTGSQIQVPFDISAAQVNLTIQRPTGPLTLALAIKPVSPAIFLDRDGAPMLLDGETGLMLDPSAAARPQSRVQLLATGLGKVTPDWPSGVAAPAENPPAVAARVAAFLNGSPVEVTRATLAPGYVGLYLVEIQLPALLDSGTAELYLAADGQESNRVRISLDALN